MSLDPLGVAAGVGLGHTGTGGLPATLDRTLGVVAGTTGANAVDVALDRALLEVDGGALTGGAPLAGHTATVPAAPVVLALFVVSTSVLAVALGESAATDLVTAALLVTGLVALAGLAKLRVTGTALLPSEVAAAGLAPNRDLLAGLLTGHVVAASRVPLLVVAAGLLVGEVTVAALTPFGVLGALGDSTVLGALGGAVGLGDTGAANETLGNLGAGLGHSGFGGTLFVVDRTTLANTIPRALDLTLGIEARGALTGGAPLAGHTATVPAAPVVLALFVVSTSVLAVALGESAATDLVTAALLVTGLVALAGLAKLRVTGTALLPSEVAAASLFVGDVLLTGLVVVEVTLAGLAPRGDILTGARAGDLTATFVAPYSVCLAFFRHIGLAAFGTSLLAVGLAGVYIASGLVVDLSRYVERYGQ